MSEIYACEKYMSSIQLEGISTFTPWDIFELGY